MAVRIDMSLKTRNIAAVIAGSGDALRAVAAGTSPVNAAAVTMVALIKEQLSQPGLGRLYTTEWRTIRNAQGEPISIPLRKRPRPPHRASAPAQPPAVDEGILRASIGFEIRFDSPISTRARIGTIDKEAKVRSLEFGSKRGSRIAPRPFMRPAIVAGKAAMADTLINALRAQAKKQGRARQRR